MARTLVALVAGAVLGVGVAACVDIEGGETGTYGTPCGPGFAGLLRCGLEGGGADPGGDPGPPGGDTNQPATCDSACTVIVGCLGGTPADHAECVGECSSDGGVTQQLLDCIVEMGCNYQACIETQN